MKMRFFAMNLLIAMSFCACSSKVQTNKIPDDKKYILPKNTSAKELRLNTQSQNSFEEALRTFLRLKIRNKRVFMI